ncbi:hypothetical protein COY14_03395 [Candidatus Roizmanbacteria bacterium CG_4_10_14_0_2_um_filter_36_9]|uniref:Uncharacterized protein n=1 Tax=Candidatus Roizmanbacteria bacterium CG_4_10_14_0_2_um_filter_36_9 TaxID=1974823 RepID=A0A2M7U3R8_9BACT|nr:MAG: hypothetical protein COY14_03395 [Candidatus Roizmanbacteria bacterium CG_4_10_14_0_2_um_filter_36_9]
MNDNTEGNDVKMDGKIDKKNKNESNTSTPSISKDNIEEIMNLETMIKGYMSDLEKYQEDLRDQASMLKDSFEQDAEYTVAQEKVLEATRKRKVVRDRIIAEPAIASLESKVEDLRAEVKETKTALSDYLERFFQKSGLRQITGNDGEIREMVTTVRLVKKRD